MPVLKLGAFGGERPVLAPRLLPDTAAQNASNVRLSSGTLSPIKKAAIAGQGIGANHKTIYRHGVEWLSWPGRVHAVPGPVAQDRVYFTGDGVPKLRVDGQTYPLAVPRPGAAMAAAVAGVGDGDIQTRGYTYTFVTAFGEESAPAPLSSLIDWKPGQTVTLTGLEAPAAGRNITRQRFYRTQTGTSGTMLYFIAERAVATTDFLDDIPVDAFQEAMPSADYNTPPDALTGLIAMPNGMMAAFVGKQVYFSEPWRPHAWPEKYIQTCDAEIVGLGAIGPVLIVMTKENPYIMTGAHPDSVQSQKLESNFPCINADGIADLGYAVCYPSNLGLVVVTADGGVKLATAQLFSRDDWLELSPSTIRAGQLNGDYLLFYDTTDSTGSRAYGTLFISVGADPYLIRSPVVTSAVYYSVADEALFFTKPNDTKVYQFDAPGAAPEAYYWKSKEFIFTNPVNFGAIMIEAGKTFGLRSWAAIENEVIAIRAANAEIFAAGDLHSTFGAEPVGTMAIAGDTLLLLPNYLDFQVNVYGDGELHRTITKDGSIERLPGKRKARKWEIDVKANIEIEQIIMASTIDEIRNMA